LSINSLVQRAQFRALVIGNEPEIEFGVEQVFVAHCIEGDVSLQFLYQSFQCGIRIELRRVRQQTSLSLSFDETDAAGVQLRVSEMELRNLVPGSVISHFSQSLWTGSHP